ncbi:zinc-binding domain-containing protein [Xylariaceae sp. FL1272]|nr:zinc-binding domain-containing protein [Xylariaceae sp. FL1272]
MSSTQPLDSSHDALTVVCSPPLSDTLNDKAHPTPNPNFGNESDEDSTVTSEDPKESREWSMYPGLHDVVAARLKEVKLDYMTFHEDDNRYSASEEYDTHIQGYFQCDNLQCPAYGWPSGKMAISIRFYGKDEYNARVWHQRCRECDHLADPQQHEESYVERVVYRIKKWYGIYVKPSPWRYTPPHEPSLCEGCLYGHCINRDASKTEGEKSIRIETEMSKMTLGGET